MANAINRLRIFKYFTFLLCIAAYWRLMTGLLMVYRITSGQNTHPKVITHEKNNSYTSMMYKNHKNFCFHVNANWPRDFPKIVNRGSYVTQRIPYPFFQLSKWDNSHLDLIADIISPNEDHYKSVDIISIISSSWPAFESRLALRQTLGTFRNVNGNSHKIVFLIGQPNKAFTQDQLQKEANLYGDILQIDTDDSYGGLTKKRFQGLKWAIKTCKSASLLLYLTDDIVINIPNIIQKLEPIHNIKRLAYGCVNRYRGKVFTNGKYRIFSEPPLNWTTHPYTPEFIFGYAIVFSMDVATDLYKLACKTPLTFSDDRYIGILLAMLKVPLLDSRCERRNKEDRNLGNSYSKTKLKNLISDRKATIIHLYSNNETAYVMKEAWKDLTFN